MSEFPPEDLKAQFKIQGMLIMYVGNLERYQGIDLLIESFAKVLKAAPNAHLVAIGGNASDIQKYRTQASEYQTSSNIHFIGSRPVTQLKQYLDQADIVVSPRIQGSNTPMKIYSYLDSGKALLATDLTTHTQVLNSKIAHLAAPNVAAFAAGMQYLIDQPELRARLGRAAQSYIAKAHTYEAFSTKLNALYDWIDGELRTVPAASSTSSMVVD
ncbi:MAG: glycosyltransferase family 4 protein [Phormidesmis sp.]